MSQNSCFDHPLSLFSDTIQVNKGKIQRKKKYSLSKNYLISDILGLRYNTLLNGRTMEMNITVGNQSQIYIQKLLHHLKKNKELKTNHFNLNQSPVCFQKLSKRMKKRKYLENDHFNLNQGQIKMN